MPEHDTFDLDAAFAALEQNIAGLSSPRDAGAAIATARRRRRTAIGGAFVGLALVIGAVVAGQGIASRNESVGPAQLPTPALFDAPALSAATEGWVSHWGYLSKPGQFSNPRGRRSALSRGDGQGLRQACGSLHRRGWRRVGEP